MENSAKNASVLLKKLMKEAIELNLQFREVVDVSPINKYLFAC